MTASVSYAKYARIIPKTRLGQNNNSDVESRVLVKQYPILENIHKGLVGRFLSLTLCKCHFPCVLGAITVTKLVRELCIWGYNRWDTRRREGSRSKCVGEEISGIELMVKSAQKNISIKRNFGHSQLLKGIILKLNSCSIALLCIALSIGQYRKK